MSRYKFEVDYATAFLDWGTEDAHGSLYFTDEGAILSVDMDGGYNPTTILVPNAVLEQMMSLRAGPQRVRDREFLAHDGGTCWACGHGHTLVSERQEPWQVETSGRGGVHLFHTHRVVMDHDVDATVSAATAAGARRAPRSADPGGCRTGP